MGLTRGVDIYYNSPRTGYLRGEVINAEVKTPDGLMLGQMRWRIEQSPGSGFAGQVYRAVPASEVSEGIGQPPVKGPVALKVLRPRSRWKTIFRDVMFWICFQAPFAPRLREEAVRMGMIWQEILRRAASVELGDPDAVVCPIGYFWDADLASFVEVNTWVEGRAPRYQVDDDLLSRRIQHAQPPPLTEMAHKKNFMDALAGLCYRMGAIGLARQYEWYTLVSQPNVLLREGLRFTAVDCRPGLAFPFFMPFTLVHARLALEGLRRGMLVHYDEVDFARLDAYMAAHPETSGGLKVLVEQLRRDDATYRGALFDLWHTRSRFLWDPAFRRRLREAAIQDWLRTRQVDAETANKMRSGSLTYIICLLLSLTPFIGGWLARVFGSSLYRRHLESMLSDSPYRRAAFTGWRKRDLPQWISEGRVSRKQAAELENSLTIYLAENMLFGWLPPALQRLMTNPPALWASFLHWIVRPLRLLVNQGARSEWVAGVVMQEMGRGVIDPHQAEILKAEMAETRMQGFIRDLGMTAGMDLISRLLYLLLALYGFSTGNFLPLGVAAFGPVPPSGIMRTVYVLIQLLRDLAGWLFNRNRAIKMMPGQRQEGEHFGRIMMARTAGLMVAPWRWVGNLFAVFEISVYYPWLSLLVGDYYASVAAGWIPIFGGRGKLLEYWTFQFFYSLPVGVFRELEVRLEPWRKSQKTALDGNRPTQRPES